MKLQATTFAVVATVVLFLGHAACQDATDHEENAVAAETAAAKGVPTYVGPIERLILLLMKPVEITEDALGRIGKGLGKGLRDIVDKIPLLKDAQSKARTGKSIGDVLNPFKDKIRAIYPGTLWCGDGDIASDSEDLGIFKETDACCRAHDSCVGGIPAQEERHGLLNNGLFTRSPCPCDKAFYRCLKEATNLVATKIGTTYFNILRPQCLEYDYPIEGCNKYAGARLIHDKCLEYEFNTNGTKKYQWFDNPDFLG